MSQLVLVKLGRAHLSRIRQIASVSFFKVWTESEFLYFVEHGCGYGFGLETKDAPPRLAAYVLGLLVQHELDIISIATAPEDRRQGYARSLMEMAQRDPAVHRITLEVEVGNEAAIALYQALGFQRGRTRAKYYDQTRDALEMSWDKK